MSRPSPADIRSAILTFLAKHGRRGRRTQYAVTSSAALYLLTPRLRDAIDDIDILADITAPQIKEVINGIKIDGNNSCHGLEDTMYSNFEVIDGIRVASLVDVMKLKKIISRFEFRRKKWPQDHIDMRRIRALIRSRLRRTQGSDGRMYCFYRGKRVSSARYDELVRI